MLSLLLAVALGGADSLAGPGISSALAQHRSHQISNVRYEVALDVRSRDHATGHVQVRFDRLDTGDVWLDFRGRGLEAPAGVVANGAHIRIPAAMVHDGENTFEFAFTAPIAPAGTSIIRFHDAKDSADYLYTLFVPADANALFPCFDQPDLKAKVTLALTIPRGWSAVANGPAVTADSSDSGVTVRFAESKPISTYLIAFAAGPWARVTSGDMTLYVRASRRSEVEADTILSLNQRAVRWLEGYFDRPFPFQKFDVVLAPSFPFGGMEHPGAVFYNEESFIFRERPTLNQRLGREATVFHEVAHQWFGDLVTMRWFDDLWLKEGFASYMAAVMQAALDTSAGAWKTFYLRNRPLAYAVDVTDGTTPVWQALGNLDQAKSAYGPIVYDKAPAILKQLAFLVGDTAFRDGLRTFLRDHAYANATWRDLLASVGASSHRSLDAWGQAYILRPGMPVVDQRVGLHDGRIVSLTLTQHPAQALSGPGGWPLKLNLTDGTAVEFTGADTTVPIEGSPSFVYANAGDYGYALLTLDPTSVAWLESHIEDVHDPLLRAMLWGSLWDLVRDARLAPARFIRLVERTIAAEPDEQIAPFVLTRTVRAMEAYVSPHDRRQMDPELERRLTTIVEDTARPFGLRKAALDALVATAATPASMVRLDGWLDRDSLAGAPLKEPTRWAIVTALIGNRSSTAAARYAAEMKRDPGTEGARRAFIAQAAQPVASDKARYWDRYLRDTTLNEEWVTASLRAFNAPEASALTRQYLEPALDTLPWIQRNRRIFFLGQWVSAFLDGQTSPDALHAVDHFLATHPTLPSDLRLKILQSEDELRRTVRIRTVRIRTVHSRATMS